MTSSGRSLRVWVRRLERNLASTAHNLSITMTSWSNAVTHAAEAARLPLAMFLPLDRVSWAESHFRHTENPLFAWEAFRLCREAGVDPPPWVLAYLDATAASLLLLQTETDGRPASDIKPRVAAAAGFGSGRIFTQYGEFQKRFHLALHVLKKRPITGKLKYSIEETAATHGGE